ncbi:hypothetical protein KI387_039344 [Taxus chinensis]|uniref:FAD-binding domain-containing protein n=1 Tax=Taxus chinensis TaxID=29808 RepID=A0AA38CAK0_TAXCH|nr:hypothetical protein KI387_039344 [Taxus chinensis]
MIYFEKQGVIGCDGVNSVVAHGFLNLPHPAISGRCGIRGMATYPEGHGLQPRFQIRFLNGISFGRVPINDKDVFWFAVCSPPPQGKEYPEEITELVSRAGSDSLSMTVLRFQWAWKMLEKACKGSVTVAGDAVHPMTPDLGQGGCSALEDAIVVARCLAQGLNGSADIDKEAQVIEEAFNKYANERKWRWIWLVSQAYITGFVQQGSSGLARFIRDKILLKIRSRKDMFIHATYDCGTLPNITSE